jgi:bifunctional NMN adenylyltransferase/nudix hydrolase
MKTAYVIGRFQPFHNGHKKLIDFALTQADRVVVLIGDTGCARSFRDPWTVDERASRIHSVYADCRPHWRIRCLPIFDEPYDNEAWAKGVKDVVRPFSAESDENIIVGMRKDETSFYLDLFPEFKLIEMPKEEAFDDELETVSGTKLRRIIFNPDHPSYEQRMKWVRAVVPEQIASWVENCESRQKICDEYKAILEDEILWRCPGSEKYGQQPKVAVDVMLHTKDKILVIRRGSARGRGTLALPGGYLDPGERLHVGALRELKEETGIVMPLTKRDASPMSMIPFDHPQRSSGIRTITNVLVLFRGEEFPYENRPVPGDDAQNAFWLHKSSLNEAKREFFSDHWHIIKTITF